MFPDVINAKHDDGGGGIVHEGHAGVNMDDVRSSGQWVEVPAVANELCDFQILYEEQEDYFCAEAMGWATRIAKWEAQSKTKKECNWGTKKRQIPVL